MLTRWLRAPLTHFVLIGLVLFLLQGLLATDEPPPLVISQERLAQLSAEWASHNGAPPDAEQARQLIEEAVHDELLMEVALEHELHREDPQVRRRLVRLGRFVTGASEASPAKADTQQADSEHELFEQALELGLHRRDALARQRLTDGARVLLSFEEPQPLPSDDELRTFLKEEREIFELPDRVRLVQLLFPEAEPGRAAEALERLQQGGIGPEAAELPGAPPPPPRRPGAMSRADLQRRFSNDFADLAFGAETGRWVGPVSSPWGEHLLWVEEQLPRILPDLQEHRERLTESWIRHRQRTRLTRALEELEAQREVVVLRPPGFGDRDRDRDDEPKSDGEQTP